MTLRILPLTAVGVLGIVLGSVTPELAPTARTVLSSVFPAIAAPTATGTGSGQVAKGHAHGSGETHEEGPEGVVRVTAERISAAGIAVAPAESGAIARTLTVPGVIVPDQNRIARVAAKVIGTVADMNKQLGDPVAQGEVVAVVESREVAEAKSEYLAAQANLDLQKTLFDRGLSLYHAKITPENQFLRAQTTLTEAQLRYDLARHKLSALSVADAEIAALKRETTSLQRHEVRSPIAGRVVERLVALGASVGVEGQAKELYVVADLATVWVDLTVPTGDLGVVEEGQTVTIAAADGGQPFQGRIVFISPMLNQDTRSARVIAALDNRGFAWRPGSFVTARIVLAQQPVDVKIPRSAVQTIGGEQVVFVRTGEGFEKREVVLGKTDDQTVEVLFGLDPGEAIAVANTFVLKAELGKAEAEHAH